MPNWGSERSLVVSHGNGSLLKRFRSPGCALGVGPVPAFLIETVVVASYSQYHPSVLRNDNWR